MNIFEYLLLKRIPSIIFIITKVIIHFLLLIIDLERIGVVFYAAIQI